MSRLALILEAQCKEGEGLMNLFVQKLIQKLKCVLNVTKEVLAMKENAKGKMVNSKFNTQQLSPI